MILYFTAQTYRQQILNRLAAEGLSAVSPLLVDEKGQPVMTLSAQAIKRLRLTTPVRGIAFFESGRTIARDVYGEPPSIFPDRFDPNRIIQFINKEGTRYDVTYSPEQMRGIYATVLRLNSEGIEREVWQYVTQSALVSLLLSAFITSVLILVLGKWMIEPILLLRNNLLGAAKNPESPMKYLTVYSQRDELGSVISSANKLIKQNAENMTRLNQQAQDNIFRLAFFDSLTELPNRAHFINKLDEILNSNTPPMKLGVLVVDIDHFGDINDTLGYEAGDEILRDLGRKLKERLTDTILIARISEDEFAAIIDMPEDPYDKIKEVSTAVLDIFANTFDIQGNELVLEGTVGMALWPNDADRGIDLLKKAESALDQAKQEDKDHFCLYNPAFEQAVHHRVQMVRDLRMAIEEKHFTLVYQPQFSSKTREMIGAEALLRWERPDPETGKKAFVRPDHFIPVAEQSGLIVPIGRWVIEEACRFAKECQEQGIKPFRVAVNLSGIQFHRDDVVSLTRDVLQRTGLAPHYLELEVTESAVMKDINETIGLLQQLKDLGVELAIDDFGTGYSSLSYLKRFPVHRLKVDRSFVMNLGENDQDSSITTTIIQLGHSIGLKVIAEGVETEKQVELLTGFGCDEFQGYFFSKPLPPTEFRGFAKGYLLK